MLLHRLYLGQSISIIPSLKHRHCFYHIICTKVKSFLHNLLALLVVIRILDLILLTLLYIIFALKCYLCSDHIFRNTLLFLLQYNSQSLWLKVWSINILWTFQILSIEFIKIKVKLIRNIADMKLNINSYILMGKLYFLLNWTVMPLTQEAKNAKPKKPLNFYFKFRA